MVESGGKVNCGAITKQVKMASCVSQYDVKPAVREIGLHSDKAM
jgi:hypothetical protein